MFATLFLNEIQDWLEFVETKLKRLRSPNGARVAQVLTDALRDRQRFCRLGVVLASILERNMSTEFIRDFKLELNTNLQRIVGRSRQMPLITYFFESTQLLKAI